MKSENSSAAIKALNNVGWVRRALPEFLPITSLPSARRNPPTTLAKYLEVWGEKSVAARASNESLRDNLFECGFSHPRARYFSLRGQRKVSQRKAARLPLESCAPQLSAGGNRRDIPVPRSPSGIHSAPLRVIPAENSGARRGKRGFRALSIHNGEASNRGGLWNS